MSPLLQNIRIWWQPPRQAGHRLEHRQVTFLELFYDLVYVAIIAELSHALASHIGWVELGRFVFLFVIVWWAWLNGTVYHDIHGNNDVRTRVLTFLQMFTVVAMAVFAHDAMGDSSVGFALSYAAFQLILTYMWWRTGVHDPHHAVLSRPYSAAFLLNTLLFAGSAFVAPPLRFYMWGVALVISLLLPMATNVFGRFNAEAQEQMEISGPVGPSLVERFGLFSIIVLGEVIIGVVGGVTEHHDLTLEIGITALLGTLIAIALWWLYFDFISHRLPHLDMLSRGAWYYLHLPTTIGITIVGASVLSLVEHAGEHVPVGLRWLFVAGAVIAVLGILLLARTIQLSDADQHVRPSGSIAMLVSAVLIALLGLTSLEAVPLLLVAVILLLAPVFVALRAWVAFQVENSS
ncbi:MAG: low temperature requirement protein A [Chloroflexi bacterium]|nr:MAG: low temperature requirement protein A [Chloroflexota bacterium]MBL1196383.1 low temperature requirement protein A [Chloroflexota bacterium]NOH13678.1 low temperature requirement protein A [Chloroflexota bacterium]